MNLKSLQATAGGDWTSSYEFWVNRGLQKALGELVNGPGLSRKLSQLPCTHKHPDLQVNWKQLHSLQAVNEVRGIPWLRQKKHVQPSCSPGVYWLLIKMINWEPIGSLAPNFLSYLFWNFFSCHSTRIWGSNSSPPATLYFWEIRSIPWLCWWGVGSICCLRSRWGLWHRTVLCWGRSWGPPLASDGEIWWLPGCTETYHCEERTKSHQCTHLNVPTFTSTELYTHISKCSLRYRQNTQYSSRSESRPRVSAI